MGFLGQPPPPLLLGLCHLAGACPPKVLAGIRGRLMPWLVAAVAGLAHGPLGDGPAVLSALGVLQSSLSEAEGETSTPPLLCIIPLPTLRYPLTRDLLFVSMAPIALKVPPPLRIIPFPTLWDSLT